MKGRLTLIKHKAGNLIKKKQRNVNHRNLTRTQPNTRVIIFFIRFIFTFRITQLAFYAETLAFGHVRTTINHQLICIVYTDCKVERRIVAQSGMRHGIGQLNYCTLSGFYSNLQTGNVFPMKQLVVPRIAI